MQKLTTVLLLGLTAAAQLVVAQEKPAVPATPKPKTSTAAKPATAKTSAKPASAKAPVTLTTQKDKFSYAVGLGIAKTLQRQGVEVDPALVSKGMTDVLSGATPLLNDKEAQAVLMEMQAAVQKKQQQLAQALADENKKKGAVFLAENAKQPGVVTLPSGLQYKILKEGTGPKPTAADTVVCNYRGTLIDGKEFDSSYKRGEPASFPVSGVIKGWTEALQLMPVGSKWQLFLPPDLAYGERGAGQDIGPNSTLIFEVELLSIKEKEKSEPAKEKPETPK